MRKLSKEETLDIIASIQEVKSDLVEQYINKTITKDGMERLFLYVITDLMQGDLDKLINEAKKSLEVNKLRGLTLEDLYTPEDNGAVIKYQYPDGYECLGQEIIAKHRGLTLEEMFRRNLQSSTSF